MPPTDRPPIWPSSLSTKDPLNHATLKARAAEYQAVSQFFTRFATSPSYTRCSPSERRTVLRKKVIALLDKREQQGRANCSIDVDEMIERHMAREAEMKRLKKAGIVKGRFPSNIVRGTGSGVKHQASVEDEVDEEEDEASQDQPTRSTAPTPRIDAPLPTSQDTALRIERLENAIKALQAAPPPQAQTQAQPQSQPQPFQADPPLYPEFHQPNPPNIPSHRDLTTLQTTITTLHAETTALRAQNQFLYTQLRTHHERITALEDHAVETNEGFARLAGLQGMVNLLVQKMRGGGSHQGVDVGMGMGMGMGMGSEADNPNV